MFSSRHTWRSGSMKQHSCWRRGRCECAGAFLRREKSGFSLKLGWLNQRARKVYKVRRNTHQTNQPSSIIYSRIVGWEWIQMRESGGSPSAIRPSPKAPTRATNWKHMREQLCPAATCHKTFQSLNTSKSTQEQEETKGELWSALTSPSRVLTEPRRRLLSQRLTCPPRQLRFLTTGCCRSQMDIGSCPQTWVIKPAPQSWERSPQYPSDQKPSSIIYSRIVGLPSYHHTL